MNRFRLIHLNLIVPKHEILMIYLQLFKLGIQFNKQLATSE